MTQMNKQLMIGVQLVLDEQIAERCTSALYVGHLKKHGKTVVVKVYRPEFAEQERREIKLYQRLSRLHASHFAQFYGVCELHGGRSGLVLELVPGVPLDEYLVQHETSFLDRKKIARQIVNAAISLHEVCGQDEPPIDFSLPDILVDKTTERVWLVDPAPTHGGTPPLCSPEVLETIIDPLAPGADLGRAADVYVIAGLVFFALTSEAPFAASTDSLVHLRDHQLTGAPRWRALPRRTPSHLRATLAQAFNPDPEQRPSLGDVQRALQTAPRAAA